MGFFQNRCEKEMKACIGDSIVAQQLLKTFNDQEACRVERNQDKQSSESDSDEIARHFIDRAESLIRGLHIERNDSIQPSYEAADVCVQALSSVRDNAVSRNESRAGASTILGVISLILGVASLILAILTGIDALYSRIFYWALAGLVGLSLVAWGVFVYYRRKVLAYVEAPCDEMMSWLYLLKMKKRIREIDDDMIFLFTRKTDLAKMCEMGILRDGDRLNASYFNDKKEAVVHYENGRVFFTDLANPCEQYDSLNSIYHALFPDAGSTNAWKSIKKGDKTFDELRSESMVKIRWILPEQAD